MRIEIDPKYEARLKEIAEFAGRTVQEIIEEAIAHIVENEPPWSDEPMTEEQHKALMADLKRIRNLPEGTPPDDDRDVARNHDKYIYRKDW